MPAILRMAAILDLSAILDLAVTLDFGSYLSFKCHNGLTCTVNLCILLLSMKYESVYLCVNNVCVCMCVYVDVC